MATKCFCGCDRDVPRFPLFTRSANNLGRDVEERLAWARAVMGDELDAGWEADGEQHLEALQAAIHDRYSLDTSALQRWLVCGRKMESLVRQMGGPPINLWLGKPGAIGAWMRQFGLSSDEAARELNRRANAGEPMPWMDNVWEIRNVLRRTREEDSSGAPQ
jgi:hypothetical protein